MSKPILCLDFDGVIHSYTSGWQGADVISDGPVDGAELFIHEAMKHFTVAIYSTRSHDPGGIKAMQEWFGKWMLIPIDKLSWPGTKPPAFLTIDDRAITFEGAWPNIDVIRKFKPWNKR